MTLQLPVELLREIIAHLINEPPCPPQRNESSKPPWGLIHSISLASKTFRLLSLEAWFGVLFCTAPEQIDEAVEMFPGTESWVKKLHCVEFAADPTKMWNLERLNNLRSIRFDFRGIVFDQTDIMDPDSGAALFAFSASAARIRHLDLRNLDWPAPWMLRHISLSFNGLESLYLEQDPIWCSLCNTCNLAQFKDPGPDFIVYTNGVGLPKHYMTALSSLSSLTSVSISIANIGAGHTSLGMGEGKNTLLWAGECDRCMEVMYDDQEFREGWVSQKKDPHRGGPPALQRVEWWFRQIEPSEWIAYDDEWD